MNAISSTTFFAPTATDEFTTSLFRAFKLVKDTLVAEAKRDVFQPLTLTLSNQGTHSMAKPQGRTVICTKGTLWVTFDWDSKDTILEAGESIYCESTRLLFVQALTDANFQIV